MIRNSTAFYNFMFVGVLNRLKQISHTPDQYRISLH